jgi:hypothetical protein
MILLDLEQKAAVWRREPFTIILKRAVELDAQPPIQFKVERPA